MMLLVLVLLLVEVVVLVLVGKVIMIIMIVTIKSWLLVEMIIVITSSLLVRLLICFSRPWCPSPCPCSWLTPPPCPPSPSTSPPQVVRRGRWVYLGLGVLLSALHAITFIVEEKFEVLRHRCWQLCFKKTIVIFFILKYIFWIWCQVSETLEVPFYFCRGILRWDNLHNDDDDDDIIILWQYYILSFFPQNIEQHFLEFVYANNNNKS